MLPLIIRINCNYFKFCIPVTKLPLESVTGNIDCVTAFPLESKMLTIHIKKS